MSHRSFHPAILRPAIIHILRASGFHGATPSTLDTLTDLCADFISLLGRRTAEFAYARSSTDLETRHARYVSNCPSEGVLSRLDMGSPSVSDVRMALESISFFNSSLSASEEFWKEILRNDLAMYSSGVREKERSRRDYQDTSDIQEFLAWVTGPTHQEMRRIAGSLMDVRDNEIQVSRGLETPHEFVLSERRQRNKEDYLIALKKKHSKTGGEARFAGTVLGRASEDHNLMRIDGGPESLEDWKVFAGG